MKKLRLIAVFLTITLCLSAAVSPAFAANSAVATDIRVTLDGEARTYDVPVVNLSGRTMLPVRFLANDVGIPNDGEHIIYDNATESARLISTDGSIEATFKRGSKDVSCVIDGETKTVQMDVECINYGGRLFIPVRFASEIFGLAVDWDNHTRTVLLRTPESLVKAKAALERLSMPEKYSAEIKQEVYLTLLGKKSEIGAVESSYQVDLEKNLVRSISMVAEEPLEIITNKNTGTMYVINADGSATEMPAPENAAYITDGFISEDINDSMLLRLNSRDLADGSSLLYGDIYGASGEIIDSLTAQTNSYIGNLSGVMGNDFSNIAFSITGMYMELTIDESGALTNELVEISMDVSDKNDPSSKMKLSTIAGATFDYTSQFEISIPTNIAAK